MLLRWVLPFVLSFANKPFMLSVIMMNVVMASVVMITVVILNDVLPPTRLYFPHFLFWQQWQRQDENPWTLDDEASFQPLCQRCWPTTIYYYFRAIGLFFLTRSGLPGSLVAQPFSVLSFRAADKKSSSSPTEADTSLVKSQLIYLEQRRSALHYN